GRLLADVPRVHLVHRSEVGQVRQVDGRLHEPVEPAAGGLEDRLQVAEDLLGLLRDVAAQLARPRLQRELPRHEDEPAGADRLRVRRALERRRRLLGADDRLLHRHSFRLQAWATATPSALNIASSTLPASSPAIRRTCRLIRAPSAKARSVSATTSLPSPPRRASERSTLETKSGASDVSSTTCASASAAGIAADP